MAHSKEVEYADMNSCFRLSMCSSPMCKRLLCQGPASVMTCSKRFLELICTRVVKVSKLSPAVMQRAYLLQKSARHQATCRENSENTSETCFMSPMWCQPSGARMLHLLPSKLTRICILFDATQAMLNDQVRICAKAHRTADMAQ